MCFILSNVDMWKIFDSLEDRRSFQLIAYSMRFTYHARENVSRIVMNMTANYDSVTKVVCPNARISIDRFHVNHSIVRCTNNG
ncbi:transposase [Enterococcus avium]|uniref:transposase n=1 Tax=Enterococcus avium TaxID=33945 RepID=UPI0021F1EC9E|nr:transposase [Enterococcus avium]